MNRSWRKFLSFCLAGLVVFAQVAVGGHACQTSASGMSGPSLVHATGDRGSPDEIQPHLCFEHCNADQQNVSDTVQLGTQQAFVPTFSAMLPANQSLTAARLYQSPALLRDISPPLTIRNCCFRI